jgi:(2R)-ethylmalonyl-CoA mutase
VPVSVLSGSHVELCEQLFDALRELGATDIPVVVGGIIPPEDHTGLTALGVARIFTAADSSLGDVMTAIVDVIEQR